jgi:glycosyltransferase involved in cell wall biosynthesis
MKLVSIVTPCFNEEENVEELHRQVARTMEPLQQQYRYEHIFIDNASSDGTASILRSLAAKDPRVKVIFNTRNFGHIRSPHHAMLQARGDAIILIMADLQDPPELIPELLAKWDAGYRIALCVKSGTRETWLFSLVRKAYYRLINRLADLPLVKDATGFGLYDRCVMEHIRKLDDPYPYFRGMLSDSGYSLVQIPYVQPRRQRGFSKNRLYTLYDLAMLGITNHSKVPLRVATFAGLTLSCLSMGVAMVYLVLKLVFWDYFALGTAPLLIGVFFFGSVQLFFIGILGEYIGAIHTQVLKRPLVVEKERLNFEEE